MNPKYRPKSNNWLDPVFTAFGRKGNILLLGIYFHEIFMSGLVQQGVAPRSEGAPLTSRVRQCLIHAARGLTSADIGRRLDIAERTVEFHFAGIRSKLSVNRQGGDCKGDGFRADPSLSAPQTPA
jgi:DNA-binding CsgD family transcriptional regulator